MEQLGINPVLVVAQIVSFGILFLVFNKFLYPKIQEALNKRRSAVAAALAGKEDMEKKLVEFEKDKAKQLKAGEEKTKALLLAAKKQADSEKRQIMTAAQKVIDRQRQKARDRIEMDITGAKQELNHHTKQLAAQIAKKMLLAKSSDPKWQRSQIKDSISRLHD